MPQPDPPKSYLILAVPAATDPIALAMAKLYMLTPGPGMFAYFSRIEPDSLHFGVRDGEGTSNLPDLNKNNELNRAKNIITAAFNDSAVVAKIFTEIVKLAQYDHDDYGLIKIATLSPNATTQPIIEGLMDDFVTEHGSTPFTTVGISMDANNRPIPIDNAAVHAWCKAEIDAKKLRRAKGGGQMWEDVV